MDMLFKNKHLPSDPECLIGRHMGLEQMDILGELSRRSMDNIVDKILGNLAGETRDLVRVGCVSREWRGFVRQNRSLNRQRVEFLRQSKQVFQTNKENRPEKCIASLEKVKESGDSMRAYSWNDRPLDEKRSILKAQMRARLLGQTASCNTSAASSFDSLPALSSIDTNCLSEYAQVTTNLAEQMVVDEAPCAEMNSKSKLLGDEIVHANSSMERKFKVGL